MEVILLLLAVLAAGAFVAWMVIRRRRPVPEDDEWTLPPADGTKTRPAPPAAPEPPPRLDRDALLKPPRAFDPSRWDDPPAGDGEEAEEDLPRFFDRDYLRQRGGRGPASAAGAASGSDAAEAGEPPEPGGEDSRA